MCCLYIKQKRYTNAALHVREKCYKSMKKNEQNRTEHVHYLRCLQTLIYIYIYIYVHHKQINTPMVYDAAVETISVIKTAWRCNTVLLILSSLLLSVVYWSRFSYLLYTVELCRLCYGINAPVMIRPSWNVITDNLVFPGRPYMLIE